MGAKRKSEDLSTSAAGGDDWHKLERRPFKRGFIDYISASVSSAEAEKRRAAVGIQIVADGGIAGTVPPPVDAFEELGVLPPWLREALAENEWYEPTPIQAQSLPIVIAGQNLVGVANDSGKSLSVLLPAAVHVEDQPPLAEMDPGPIVMVLVPTQKLAVQIAKDATKVLKHSSRSTKHPGGMKVVAIHEGGTRKEQLKQLGTSGAHIVIGTPSRIHDLASKDQLPLLRVTLLAIYELDQLIEGGFSEQVSGLSAWIRPERQTVVFSTTWPKTAAELAGQLCHAGGDPVHVSTGAKRRGNGAVGKQSVKTAKVEEEVEVEVEVEEEEDENEEEEIEIEEEGTAAVETTSAVGKKAAVETAADETEDFPSDW